MNLVGTLAKVAIGVMVSRGVGKMLGRGGSQGSGGLGGLLGGLLGSGGGQAGGGLGDLLGKALSGSGNESAGGLGGLLNGLGGTDSTAPAGNSFGRMLNDAMGGQRTPEPAPEANAQAELLLRSMINAAKCDGDIDQQEQQKIIGHLGDDVSTTEIEFVRNEMTRPLDVAAFVHSVPKGMEQQVYVMSLLGIDLDSQAEARYLDQLAKALRISQDQCNALHTKVGVPTLYS